MKRKITLLLISMLTITVCFAQEDNAKLRKKYINLGYISTTMSQTGMPDFNSKYGASFTVGRTFYLHKRPIAGILRFGLDATWLDLNYTNYKIKSITNFETENSEYHQAEISMHIGPSVTVNPVSKLNIHGYFRYAPSYSALFSDETIYGNYASFFVGGASISYGVIGLGIESRFANCKYKNLDEDSEEENKPLDKIKYSGWKVYLTFRF